VVSIHISKIFTSPLSGEAGLSDSHSITLFRVSSQLVDYTFFAYFFKLLL
jgi:hypothetical protein